MLVKPEAIRNPLLNCGYRRSLLRTDVPFGDASTIPLVAFAQLPVDSRSACVAVLSAADDPRPHVEGYRLVGAPLVFVCFHDTLQWWKQGARSVEWLESVPAEHIESFFRAHQDEFSPEAVYRAKTWGRFRREYQLKFVDLGLMPLVEEEVGEALGSLIERNVSAIAKRLGWNDVSSSQGHWLLQSVFWLISGKILRDKDVESFQKLDLNDVEEVFGRLAKHYGTKPLVADSAAKLEALRESARDVERFSNLALTTTEALAYVYENTLISKKTRTSLGTHSTPSYLVDYIVGNLADWIEEIPVNERSVFEPACGHAAFLVSAMRLLTELLPEEKAAPSRRGPYLRSRLHGTDIDPFALELARLSLTLTDIPNPDGWDLRVVDMFHGSTLEEQASRNSIILANPPFDNFPVGQRAEYSSGGVVLKTINKATEVLSRTIPALRPASVFGFVVPQGILHSAYAAELRQLLTTTCELREITLFPDGMFSFSDAESSIILGRRTRERVGRESGVRYRRVRERQMAGFRATYATSTTRIVPQSRFSADTQWDLRVPDLEEVWLRLNEAGCVSDFAEFGLGLVYHGKDLPEGVPTYSTTRFPGAHRGFVRFDHGTQLHELPTAYWMNLSEEAILRQRAGTTIGNSQLLLNYARASRGPWRLKALIDGDGHPVASRFIAVRPRIPDYSLKTLWAILNSPIANAYAYCHLGKRDNIVSDVRRIPAPRNKTFDAVERAATAYLSAASAGREPAELHQLMLRVDCEVLKLYSLPVEMEHALLDLCTGWQRVGVPFKQERYFPEELDRPIRLADFLDYEVDWPKANRRRGNLIKKSVAGAISEAEQIELDALQAYADYHIEKVAPRPAAIFDEFETMLTASQAKQRDGKVT